MLEDLDGFLALLERKAPDEIRPEDLPSFQGGRKPEPKKLVPFEVRERRERRVRPWRRLLAFILLLVIAGGIIYHEFPGEDPDPASPATSAPSGPVTLDRLLTDWRTRLNDRLMASGEGMLSTDVPLIVVADTPVDLPTSWPLHPSRRLSDEMRTLLRAEATPERIQQRLLELVGRDTVPAVLHVTAGPRPGTLVAHLYYGSLRLTDQAAR
jgi:hypothetical protein